MAMDEISVSEDTTIADTCMSTSVDSTSVGSVALLPKEPRIPAETVEIQKRLVQRKVTLQQTVTL